MKKYFLIRSLLYGSVLFLSFTQCSQKRESKQMDSSAGGFSAPVLESSSGSSPDAATSSPSGSAPSAVKMERKLTKEGTLIWETSDIRKTHAGIVEQAKKLNGYLSSDNQVRDEYQVRTTMELRIPSDKFDTFITDIEKEVNRFDEKNVKVMDVTEEYIDVTARIKTKKELEQHYYDLLKQTKNVSEVLQVEEELNNVRTDIESAEGRLKYLNDRVGMSVLNLSIYETTSAPVGFFGEIGKGFVAGWKGLLYFILGIIRAWPLVLLVFFVLFWFIRRRIRR
ncbi:MAG: DUF4349 domain-containing protein [Sphingobacteriales bacterium]|nr:DUF4349 domain-containing protein [Sphingobacteriales bacterium]